MRDGPVALAALSLHLSFSGWPHGPTCHTPEMQYVLCANELGVRKTMYFTVLGTANVVRDCSGVKLAFFKSVCFAILGFKNVMRTPCCFLFSLL